MVAYVHPSFLVSRYPNPIILLKRRQPVPSSTTCSRLSRSRISSLVENSDECHSSSSLSIAPSGSEFPPQPVWKIPHSTVRAELYVIDGLSLIEHISNSLGHQTISKRLSDNPRPIHAFLSILTSLLTSHVTSASALTVVFPAISASSMSSGVVRLSATAARLCTAFGLHVTFARDGVRDVVATLVRMSVRSAVNAVVVTALLPTPLLQLLHWPSVHLLYLSSTGDFTSVRAADLATIFGLPVGALVPSHLIPDILSLAAHAVSRIRRTSTTTADSLRIAAPLVLHFGSLSRLIQTARNVILNSSTSADCSTLPVKLARRIVACDANIRQSQHLMFLKDDLPLTDIQWQAFQRTSIDGDDLARLTSSFRLTQNAVLDRFLRAVKGNEKLTAPVRISDTFSKDSSVNFSSSSAKHSRSKSDNHNVRDDMQCLEKPRKTNNFRDIGEYISLFPVFKSLDSNGLQLVALTIRRNESETRLISLENGASLPKDIIYLLTNKSVAKHGWFLKETYKALLAHYKIRLQGQFFDYHVAIHLIYAGEPINDDYILSKFLPCDKKARSLLNDIGKKPVHVTSCRKRAQALCDLSVRLSRDLSDVISNAGLSTVMHEVESPLIPVLAEMELTGVPIQSRQLQETHDRLRQYRRKLRYKLSQILKRSSNSENFLQLCSVSDIQKFLSPAINVLASDVKNFLPLRGPAVNGNVLSRITQSKSLPIKYRRFAFLLLQYREVSKLLCTDTRSLLENIHEDWRVHPKFSQITAGSGRISTSRPNLQTLPSRSAILKGGLRRLIKAKEGKCIVSADYCQIELRIAAAFSKDPNLISSFRNNEDVHKTIAARMYGLSDVNSVTSLQRSTAKRVVYSILYGVSVEGLAGVLGIPRRDAELLILQFYKSYPTIKGFSDVLTNKAVSSGRARSLLGRHQWLPRLVNGCERERARARRIAVNMPIQGTQADMLKLAMGRIWQRLHNMKSTSALIMQLHDELVFEVDECEREDVIHLIEEEMENALPLLNVAVVVKIGYGPTWLTASETASRRT